MDRPDFRRHPRAALRVVSSQAPIVTNDVPTAALAPEAMRATLATPEVTAGPSTADDGGYLTRWRAHLSAQVHSDEYSRAHSANGHSSLSPFLSRTA